MMYGSDYLALADWRRQVAALYGRIREADDPQEAWRDFRLTRDRLFAGHAQTPLEADQRQSFTALNYYPYDVRLRMEGEVVIDEGCESSALDLPGEGIFHFTRFARVSFTLEEQKVSLAVYWVEGYGGGLFLPFRDKSNGRGSYGGGRYLYDSIKGADLGAGEKEILLDFNFAYNPSCAYNDRWICPLAPLENWLNFAVTAGEKAFSPVK